VAAGARLDITGMAVDFSCAEGAGCPGLTAFARPGNVAAWLVVDRPRSGGENPTSRKGSEKWGTPVVICRTRTRAEIYLKALTAAASSSFTSKTV
jgi:hypothetical protein